MIKIDPNISSILTNTAQGPGKSPQASGKPAEFNQAVKALENYAAKVDDLQHSSDASIKDLLSGKNEDIMSVVSAVAKADISFKVLVGVRNKLVEAYKQTMNMQV